MKKLLNFEYATIHGTYWMFYGVICSFSSVFLLAKDYSNTDIGIILAVGSVLAVVMQPLIADFADRTKKISLIGIMQIMTVMMMAMTVGLYVFERKSIVLTVIFVMLTAWITVIQPLANTLSFKLERSGLHINFGVCRSFGSLAFAVLVAFLGTIVENLGVITIPVSGEIVLVLLLISLYFTNLHYNKACRANGIKESGLNAGVLQESQQAKERGKTEGALDIEEALLDEEEIITLMDFVKSHKLFIILNLGIVGLYFSNSVLNNFMMQIVADVGGNSEDMGRIFSVMAALEIPTMVFFDRLRKHFSNELLIKIAGVGFVVKIAMCYFAKSVEMIFVAHFFQLFSFALILPAMVSFINETMKKGEAVKGQAVYTMMVTVGTVLASLSGGVILDMSGAKMLCLVATVITAAGAAVIFAVVDKVKRREG